MKYAVISDIHANETALKAVLADAHKAGADAVVCLGDVTGYGPMPAETVVLVRRSCAATVAGNHDDAVSGRTDAKDFIDLAGDAVRRHRDALSKDALQWLAQLPYVISIDGAAASHGDFTDPRSFLYIETEDDAAANFKATEAQIMFVGHTHVPGVFLTGQSGRIYKIPPQDFVAEDGKRYIVNPGSVGYPREKDGECMSSYVLYDSTEKSVVYRFLPFSVASVMQRGRGAGRIRPLLAVAAAALLAAGAAWTVSRFAGTDGPAAASQSTSTDPAGPKENLTMKTRRIAIPHGAATINPNLVLDTKAKSPPVELVISYIAPDGSTLDTETFTVRKSKTSIRVPATAKGAISAILEVRKLKPADEPAIVSFD